jgi:hypothetical protein
MSNPEKSQKTYKNRKVETFFLPKRTKINVQKWILKKKFVEIHFPGIRDSSETRNYHKLPL